MNSFIIEQVQSVFIDQVLVSKCWEAVEIKYQ